MDAFDHPASLLVLETFRLNGALIAMGDALVAPLGLTSARWQVMGAIAQAQGALPVAGIARNMGLVRQSVQRVVDELAAAGLVEFAANPHHRRAKLVRLTERGAEVFDVANAQWLLIGDRLSSQLGRAKMEEAAGSLRLMREKVEALQLIKSAPVEPDRMD